MKTKHCIAALSMMVASFVYADHHKTDAMEMKGSYPQSYLHRALTLRGGVYELGAQFQTGNFEVAQMGLGAFMFRAGLMDQLELGLNYPGFALSPFSAAKMITPHVGVGFLSEDNVGLAAKLYLPLNFGGGSVVNTVGLNLPLQFTLGDQFGIYLMHRNFLGFAFGGTFATLLNFPFEFGFQATDALFLALGTDLFNMTMAGGASQFAFIGQYVPLYLTAFYSFGPCFDLYGKFDSGDLMDVKNKMNVTLGLNYRFGDI